MDVPILICTVGGRYIGLEFRGEIGAGDEI